MSWITICNIIIINIIAWLALSYFWSGWNYKVFKPWLWLETRKRKQLHTDIETAERATADKNRFYAHWMALEQIDTNHINGDILIVGTEDLNTAIVANRHSPDRQLIVIDEFENRTIEITKENCQGEVTRQQIEIKSPNKEQLQHTINSSNCTLLQGSVSQEIEKLQNKIALATIDVVDYDELTKVLQHIYSLLSEGGIIILHDYNHNWDSVRLATDHFEANIPENFIWIPDMYGSAVMIKNKNR